MRKLIFILALLSALYCKVISAQTASAQMIGGVTPIAIADSLKLRAGSANSVVQLLGKNTIGDSQGGTYYWDPNGTDADDLVYMNTVKVTGVTTGRWRRVFSRATTLPQGYFTIIGGVKTLYAFGVTDANGECTVNLTNDNTSTGTSLFTEVWSVTGECTVAATTANDVVMGNRKSVGSTLKTATCLFSRGNNQTLGSTLLNIAGTVIPGLRAAPTGTAVLILVTGI